MRESPVRVTVALLALALLGGCQGPDSVSLFVMGASKPSAGMGGCTFGVDTPLARGTLDVSTALACNSPYQVAPILANQLRSNPSALGGDPNGILIQGAEVEIRGADGTTPLSLAGLPNPFQVPVSAFVPAGNGTAPGEATALMPGIPQAYISALPVPGTVVLAIQMFGTTNGGVDIKGAPWLWAVDLCDGCERACITADATECTTCLPGQEPTPIIPMSAPRCTTM